MKKSTDFEKYLKSKKVKSEYVSNYQSKAFEFLNDNPSFLAQNDVFAKLLNERIIFLTGDIEDYNCDLIKANLLYLEQMDDEKDIKIYINSGGGSVYSGLGLLDTMEYVSPDIITINTGLAASMAVVLLCCGTNGKRKSLRRARTMIHQPLAGFGGYLQASDLEIDAKEINSLKKELHTIISERTGKDYEKVEKDSDRDYWMDAEEALKYGMIDEIIRKK
jgi:ATP-dependent Clp protease protease subunit